MLLHPQVLEEMEEEDSGKKRAWDEEQASADMVINIAKVDGLLDIVSARALKASAEEKSMLQSTGSLADRETTPSSAAIKVHVSCLLSR